MHIKRTWSQVGRSINDGWPESTNDSENKDWSVGQQSAPTSAYSDLVQEFEPGKPWKVILISISIYYQIHSKPHCILTILILTTYPSHLNLFSSSFCAIGTTSRLAVAYRIFFLT